MVFKYVRKQKWIFSVYVTLRIFKTPRLRCFLVKCSTFGAFIVIHSTIFNTLPILSVIQVSIQVWAFFRKNIQKFNVIYVLLREHTEHNYDKRFFFSFNIPLERNYQRLDSIWFSTFTDGFWRRENVLEHLGYHQRKFVTFISADAQIFA